MFLTECETFTKGKLQEPAQSSDTNRPLGFTHVRDRVTDENDQPRPARTITVSGAYTRPLLPAHGQVHRP